MESVLLYTVSQVVLIEKQDMLRSDFAKDETETKVVFLFSHRKSSTRSKEIHPICERANEETK